MALSILFCMPASSWAQATHAEIYLDRPANVGHLLQQATFLMNERRIPEAIWTYQEAIRPNPVAPVTAPVYNNLGLAYNEMKEYSLATVCFQRAIRLQPQFALYYKNLVETYRLDGQLDTAKTTLQQAVEINPHHAEAWLMMGLIAEKQGQSQEALDAYETFITLAPGSALAQSVRQKLQQLKP